MIIDRHITKDIRKALLSKDNWIVIVYGPRQAGKTTLINHLLKEMKKEYSYYTGDDLYAQKLLSRNELGRLKKVFSPGDLVVIDEAQRIDNIALTMKLMHDNLDVRIIASGSASFDLANKLSEPLTGRTKTFNLYPLSYLEAEDSYKNVSYDLITEELLLFGLYPKVQTTKSFKDKESYLYEYINKYLYNDILQFSGIRKPKVVLDVLTLLALQIGSEVSVSEISQNLSLSHKAVENYLDILEKMFVLVNLRGFSRNLRKEVTKTSKYYFTDVGVRNAIIRNFNPLKLRSDIGALFENFFVMEKIKYSKNMQEPSNFYFWRTYDQKEIDLIQEREGRLIGYECKMKEKNFSVPSDWRKTYPEAGFEIVTPKNFIDKLKF